MLSRKVRLVQEAKEAEEEAAAEGQEKPAKEEPGKWGVGQYSLTRRTHHLTRSAASTALRVRESALFRPVRAIGMVTSEVPVAPVTLGDADFLVASVGRGFHVFDCKHLRMSYIGPRLNEKIRAMLVIGEAVITSLKHDIVAWHKLTELGRFKGHTKSPTVLANVGTAFMVSAAGSEVLLWRLSDIGLKDKSVEEERCVYEPLTKLEMTEDFGDCTAACHPPTYIHKMLLGSSTGALELWNLRSQARIHVFRSHLAGITTRCAVTCLAEVPNVLDLIAVGFANGRIVIFHGKEDRVVMEFEQAQGRVTSLSFRTGAGAPAHMVSGAPNGTFVVWDLDKRRAHHIREDAHHGPLSTATFLPGQPLLITSGRDNAIRTWIFDTADGLPRLLRSRIGCPGAVRKMSFYGGKDDRELLVGGAGFAAGFVAKVSFIRDAQNIEFSQTSMNKMHSSLRGMRSADGKRLPPLTDLAYSEVRHFDWPAVITTHERCDAAYLWSAASTTLVPKALRPEDDKDCAPVTSVAISACGNYCVLGLENGALHKFNVQSQLHRGPIPRPPEPGPSEGRAKRRRVEAPKAHLGRVCGLTITVSGQVVSLGSHPKDCQLRVWKLATHEPLVSVPLGDGRPGAPSGLLLRALGSLVAVSLDDGALLVVDLSGAAVVRSFTCGVPAADVAFSGDGRWLAAALRDGGLRIFDLLAARCVDSFVFARPALSVCFSPSSAFMMTSHAKGNAIQVWANKFLFDPSLSAPLLRPEPREPIRIDEPGAPEEAVEGDEGEEDGEEAGGAVEAAAVSAVPLAPDLLTLSDVPPQKWLATLHLDLVKERNKAIAPPKPLASAPFFLPTAHDGVTPRFVAPLEAEERPGLDGAGQSLEEASRHLSGDRASSKCAQFQQMLKRGKYDEALSFLKAQTPAGVHLAIEELGPMAQGDLAELDAGLALFEHHLGKAHFADEVQAFLSIFLQAHGEEIAGDAGLRARCGQLCQSLERRWTAINAQCNKVRCFLGMLTHTQSQW